PFQPTRVAVVRCSMLKTWGASALCLVAVSFCALGCSEKKKDEPRQDEASPKEAPHRSGPRKLYLPTEPQDDSVVDLTAPDSHVADAITFGPSPGIGPITATSRCPADMVDVAGAFCIDRFEVSLVDAKSGRELSPHFP